MGGDGIAIETLQDRFERTNTAMLIVDDDRRYRDCNEVACETLGRTREELLKLRAEDVVAPEGLPQLEERWQELIEKGQLSGRALLQGGDGTRVKAHHLSIANVEPGLHLVVLVPVHSQQDAGDWLLEGSAADANGAGRADGHGTQSAPLTPREREIVTLLAQGLTGEEIAKELVISPETVRIHVRNARRRLGARTRPQAIALAIRSGQIDT